MSTKGRRIVKEGIDCRQSFANTPPNNYPLRLELLVTCIKGLRRSEVVIVECRNLKKKSNETILGSHVGIGITAGSIAAGESLIVNTFTERPERTTPPSC